MSNRTWACVDCKQKYRRDQNALRVVKCAVCGNECEKVGWKIRVPSPRSDRKWKQFWQAYFREKELIIAAKNSQLFEAVYLPLHNVELKACTRQNT